MISAEAIRPPRGAFAALTSRSYRIYLGGQSLANTGTWMQSIAQDWLVLRPDAQLDLRRRDDGAAVPADTLAWPVHRRGGRPAAEAAHPADHADAERRRYRGAGRHHDRRRGTRGRRIRVRAAERADLCLRRAGQAGLRGRGRAAQPAPGRDRPERRGVPGHPAHRPGRRRPAYRQRGHRMGIRGQRRLLRRTGHRPAAAAAVRSHSRSSGPPRTRSAAGHGPVPAPASGRRADDLPGRDVRHVRPQLPDRPDGDGEVDVPWRRHHVRPVQHRPGHWVGDRRAVRRGRRPAAARHDRGFLGGRVRPFPGGRGAGAAPGGVPRPAGRHGPDQPRVPVHGERVGPARRRSPRCAAA